MSLTEKSMLGQIVRRLREVAHKRFVREHRTMCPPNGCIARRYAQCNDLAHCRYCTTVEQALRAAYWAKLNWARAGRRDSF